jgi:hypothetical protein
MLLEFAGRVFSKLKDMKVNLAFRPGISRSKALFKSLLEDLAMLQLTRRQITLVDHESHIPDYMRTAAKRAAQQKYQQDEEDALHKMVEVLYGDGWDIARVFAEALVLTMTTSEKALKAARRGANAEAEGMPFRYFLHVQLGNEMTPNAFFTKVTGGWGARFGNNAVLEDYGLLQGTLVAQDGKSELATGAFLIVRPRELEIGILTVESWLGSIGASTISLAFMSDIRVTDATPPAEPQPEPPALTGVEPQETH